MTPRVEIERCPTDAIPALFGFAKSVFEEVPGWKDDRVLDALEHDLVFVAREAGQLAGYVALRHDADGSFVIEQLFVVPGHERRGVGHRLLDYAEGYAIVERAPTLRIVVEEENLRARDFYTRAGFAPVGKEIVERRLPAG